MTTPALQFWPMMRRVERAAWGAIVKCIRAQKLVQVPLPIPVEAWIEGPLGIRFSIADLSELGPNVLGRAQARDRDIEVSQTLVDQDARFRFTAAHELGHILLHAKVASDFRDTADADFMERRIEREADRFAAAFLMPIPALCMVLGETAAKASVDPHALLAGAEAGDERMRQLFRATVLPLMTRRFGVSLSAVVRRFADVQFPTGDPALSFNAGLALLPSAQVQEALRRQ